MEPLEGFLGDDQEKLIKAQREEAKDKPTFFANIEEDLNDWEELAPEILHRKLEELQGYGAKVQRFGWQGENSIETKYYKGLTDRLEKLIVKAKGN